MNDIQNPQNIVQTLIFLKLNIIIMKFSLFLGLTVSKAYYKLIEKYLLFVEKISIYVSISCFIFKANNIKILRKIVQIQKNHFYQEENRNSHLARGLR